MSRLRQQKGSDNLSHTNQLDEQARRVRAEYYRQWRAKNPDKVREKNRRYWEKKAAQLNGGDTDAKKEKI